MVKFEELNKEQFFENLIGDKTVIKKIIKFYDENGNIYEFIEQCNSELGKLKKRD